VLPRRLDWSVGVFHFKNYFQSTVTSLGENLGNEELFSERSFGGLVGWTWPFDRFRRVELQYTQKFVEEIFFVERLNGAVQPINREYRSASTPTIGLTGDHALWGASGPVNGSRWNITYATGLPLFLYNAPQLAGTAMALETLVELGRGGGIAGIKDSGNAPAATRALLAAATGVPVFQGWEHLCQATPGVDGYILPLSNLEPALCRSMLEAPGAALQAEIDRQCARFDLLGDEWYLGIKRELVRRGVIAQARPA